MILMVLIASLLLWDEWVYFRVTVDASLEQALVSGVGRRTLIGPSS